ncbi:hypothetical protein HS7_05100 [Sulfolobales archaeon HS-7]|nr:hypothetical protein HS7_05100 [Sulfolobales archaeon HS-7]
MSHTLKQYYEYVVGMSLLLFAISLSLYPFAPSSEAAFIAEYHLKAPVGLSFSVFVSLIIFIITSILYFSSDSFVGNLFIESSGLSMIILNYLNYYAIAETWHPIMFPIPLFIYIKYNGTAALQFDWGQVGIIILLYRYYKFTKNPPPFIKSR